ncbi:hypothetical protein [Paenibacillus thermotolerans]|uniref:hypothetical protein n=1 Tax=Paenibacillus thermotolerans TaxID=3027807 RepID=UPI002368D31E|nr:MULTISPECIES: hypothetical protein [unclassified Paenibacillus]
MSAGTGWDPVDKLLNGIEGFLDNFWAEYRGGTLSIEKPSHDRIAEAYAPKIDSIIKKAVQMERLDYVGGNFYFELSADGGHFHNGMDLYFRRFDGEWVRKKWRSAAIPLYELILDSQTKLKREKKLEYDVTNPLEDGRA